MFGPEGSLPKAPRHAPEPDVQKRRRFEVEIGAGKLNSETIVGVFMRHQRSIESTNSMVQYFLYSKRTATGMGQIGRIPGLLKPAALRVIPENSLHRRLIELLKVHTTSDAGVVRER